MISKQSAVAFLSFCSITLCAAHELRSPLQGQEQGMSILSDTHQVVVPGSSVDNEDDDLPEDDTPSAFTHTTIASRDTLHTYTLSGHRVRKQENGLRARIIIRSGRKVLKR